MISVTQGEPVDVDSMQGLYIADCFRPLDCGRAIALQRRKLEEMAGMTAPACGLLFV